MEKILNETVAKYDLSGIGVNIFESERPRITVYLHWRTGKTCTSSTQDTFEQAVECAVAEHGE